MKLSEEQVIALMEKPKNKVQVENGRKLESRLRLFTESMFEDSIEKETAWKEFQEFIKQVLSTDKHQRVNDFIQFPLSVVEMTDSLMSDLYKVFDAGNSYFNVETVKKSGGNKLNPILKDLNVFNWIKEQGKKTLKNEPNTVVVVDKDEEGKPYIIAVCNDRLYDIELKSDKVTCEYVIFLHSVEMRENVDDIYRYSVYDDETYYVVTKIGNDYAIESQNKHQLGECPARMFLDHRLNKHDYISRKSPLTGVLSKLSEWQQFDIYKYYTDHYAPFPVTEMVRGKCGVENCNNGIITYDREYFEGEERRYKTEHKKCNVCESQNNIGVGTKILLDPQESKDEPSASGKFRMISNSTENLNYLQDKNDKIEKYVKVKVVGVDDVVTKEAVNEKQMEGAFESKTNVLSKIKTNLDGLYVWIVETVGRVTIGVDKPLNVEANFGTEWYLISEEELQKRFDDGVKAGLPQEEIDMLYCQLIETKYKGNPHKVGKLKLINQLDPLPYMSLHDKMEQLRLGLISPQDVIISQRLLTFVRRFELEQGSIMEYGQDIEPANKIQAIIDLFKTYADEQKNDYTKQLGGSKEPTE